MRIFPLTLGVVAAIASGSFLLAGGCSANDSSDGFGNNGGGAGGGGTVDAGPDGTMFGCNTCVGNAYQPCDANGKPLPEVDCDPLVCVVGMGCLECTPGTNVCVGSEIHACDDNGSPGALVAICEASLGETCLDGECQTECDVLTDSPSNIGCEFWVVDLPNERGMNSAADDPFGVVLTNAGQTTANVVIEVNNAPPGQPQQLAPIVNISIPPGKLEKVELPMRELTGWYPGYPDPPGPPMTQLTSNAFRITSSTPLVVYQFNVFTNSFSNDASLLLPKSGLGRVYRVLAMPTANPKQIEIPGAPWIAGIPDHISVTVVGTEPDTLVSVKVAHNILGDGAAIPAANAGDTVTATLGAFDVLNLSSRCDVIICTGDMTGTIVESSKPVAVFASSERTIAPFSSDVPEPPNYSGNNCCTDHLEEQMFPVTSLGKEFVITHSPPRGGTSAYADPDVLRFMGVAEPAQVTTNLPPPMNQFTLQPGQMIESWANVDFIASSTQPIMIGQILLSQGYCSQVLGDPSLTIFPPTEQFRQSYIFLVPGSWTANYFVLATPKNNVFTLDDGPLPTDCTTMQAGSINGNEYQAVRCPISEGSHKVAGDLPFGITVYGYGSAGSYAFAGGADVKEIYEPPPLK